MKKLELKVIGALSVFLLGGALPLHAATYKITWLLGHKNLDYFEEAAVSFKKTVEQASHGDIAVDIKLQVDDNPSKTFKEAPEIAAKVAKGEAEMGHSFVDTMGALDPRLLAFNAPYLFRGYRHMEGLFEGPVGKEMLDGLRAQNIVGLSFTYSGGASGVATIDRELRAPEDLKGLKVGVFGSEVDSAWLKSLGAIPVSIEHRLDAIGPMAHSGELDAVVVTWRNFEREALNTEFHRFNMPESTYLVSVTYINQKFFDSLPEKYRTLLVDASREAGRIERARTMALNEDSKRGMLTKGVRAVYLSQDHLSRFSEALRPAYASSIEPLIGKDLIDRIRRISDAPAQPAIPIELVGH